MRAVELAVGGLSGSAGGLWHHRYMTDPKVSGWNTPAFWKRHWPLFAGALALVLAVTLVASVAAGGFGYHGTGEPAWTASQQAFITEARDNKHLNVEEMTDADVVEMLDETCAQLADGWDGNDIADRLVGPGVDSLQAFHAGWALYWLADGRC